MNINKQNGQMPMKLWQKLCFAVGGVPFQMTSTAVSFFLNIFLLEVAQVRTHSSFVCSLLIIAIVI